MASERISYRIIANIGILAKRSNDWSKEVNIVSWNEGPAKLDIRECDYSGALKAPIRLEITCPVSGNHFVRAHVRQSRHSGDYNRYYSDDGRKCFIRFPAACFALPYGMVVSAPPLSVNHRYRICFPVRLLPIPAYLPVFQSHVLSLCMSRS